MTLERITEKNIDYAIQIQEELFPGESGRTNFEESMDESSGYEYFLLYFGIGSAVYWWAWWCCWRLPWWGYGWWG